MKVFNSFEEMAKSVNVCNKSYLATAPAVAVFSGVEFEKTDDGYLIATVLKDFVTDKSLGVIEKVVVPVCVDFGVEVKQKNHEYFGDRPLTKKEAEQLKWKLDLILQN